MKKLTINFDMDGTIADLYAVEGWRDMLDSHDPTPYEVAKPMLPLNILARYINRFRKAGIRVNIISWLAKNTNEEYDQKVIQAKREWLEKHLPSVTFDNLYFLPYGTKKSEYAQKTKLNILIDDETANLEEWQIFAKVGYGVKATPHAIYRTFKMINKSLEV